MSIVISTIYNKREFYIASDRRAKRSGRVCDDYKKIFNIRPRLFFGMTGIAEAGLVVLEEIKQFSNRTVSDLISETDKLVKLGPIMLTVMLAGEYDSGDFFIWQKNNQGKVTITKGDDNKVVYSISSTNRMSEIEQYFRIRISLGVHPEQAIPETIKFASTIDPAISQAYVIFKLIKE